MLRRLLLGVVAVAVLAAAAFWLLTEPRPLAADDLPAHAGDPARGEYAFHLAGCGSCHVSPGVDDPTQLGGGLAMTSPFGTFHVPNISPHPESGIGGWSTADFVNAVMRGIAPDGRHYYPSFPYTSYQRMQVEDVIDIKAYLDTLPPVQSQNSAHDLPFPYSLRRGIGLWKHLYVDGEAFAPDPAADEIINRGAYLVTGPGHCGECHTPRDRFGGLDASRHLAGGPNPEGKGSVPNITPGSGGIGDWSQTDIAFMLETGLTPDFDSVGGSMARVIRNTAKWTAEDRAAAAAYLKTVPPLPSAR